MKPGGSRSRVALSVGEGTPSGHGSIINIGSMSGLIVDRPNNQAQPCWLEEVQEDA